jgi:hypothetical protein
VKPEKIKLYIYNFLFFFIIIIFSIFGFSSDIHWLKRSNSVKELAAFGMGSYLKAKVRFLQAI